MGDEVRTDTAGVLRLVRRCEERHPRNVTCGSTNVRASDVFMHVDATLFNLSSEGESHPINVTLAVCRRRAMNAASGRCTES